jgi:hypothetical protein
MKSILSGLLLAMSVLMFSGTSSMSDESPSAHHQQQLQNSRTPAQNGVQVEDIQDIKFTTDNPQHPPMPMHDDMEGFDIKDIRPLSNNTNFLIPVGAALILLIIAILLFFILKRRRKPKAIASPPDVIALAELDRAKMLMEQPLAYAERISTILRQYIEARFQIRSTRQTTREFFSSLQGGTTIAEVDIHNHTGELQECMEQCDRAKFARSTPDSDDMMRMDTAVRTFIETTRQKHESAA